MAPCVSTGKELLYSGHIMGFGPQTRKLESPYKTPSSTPAVKGLSYSKRNEVETRIGGYTCFLTNDENF